MIAHRIALIPVVVLSVAGCGVAGQPGMSPLGEDARLVAEGNNQFALRLYQKLRDDGGNLFFSPYSISTALAMTYVGARGATQEQMAQALSFPAAGHVAQPPSAGEQGITPGGGGATRLGAAHKPLTPEELAETFGRMIKDLNERGSGNDYELRVANALWGQQGYEFLPAFVKLVETDFGGALERVNFAAADQARQTINAWVERQTNGKIKDLIGPGVLDAMTRLVLTNAIYFKGNWASQFEKDRTQDEPFTLLTGNTVQVPMMNQRSRFGYAQTDRLQILEMPYAGEELSMMILLPKKTDAIRELDQELTTESLSQWLTTMRKREVIVSVPRFKMTGKFSLGQVLQAMGMTDAFTDKADFSGMSGNRELYLSAVIHQAYVDVNEEGTEAAAATGAVVGITSVGPETTPVFRADHPFLFLIRDNKTGSILFLGRVMNP